jgi:hypothetical protein
VFAFAIQSMSAMVCPNHSIAVPGFVAESVIIKLGNHFPWFSPFSINVFFSVEILGLIDPSPRLSSFQIPVNIFFKNDFNYPV